MILGVIGFGVVTLFVDRTGAEQPEGQLEVLLVVAVGLTATMALPAVVFSGTILQRSLDHRQGAPIREKLSLCMGHKIIAAALVEGPAFFWIVLALMSGDQRFLIGAGVCVLFLVAMMPSGDKLEMQFGSEADAIDQELREDMMASGEPPS